MISVLPQKQTQNGSKQKHFSPIFFDLKYYMRSIKLEWVKHTKAIRNWALPFTQPTGSIITLQIVAVDRAMQRQDKVEG